MSLRTGSLCSGYDGLWLAIESVLGGELAWVADNDPGAAAILAHHFPAVKNLGDITLTDWAGVEPVDVLCAGFPCQDVSAAGKRAGLKAGSRSGVWLEIGTAIAALRPSLVVIENVRGLLTARGDDPTAEHLAAEATRDAAVRLLAWLETEHNLAIIKGDSRRARQCITRTIRVMGLRKRAVARCQWHERRLVRAIGTVLGSLAGLGYDAQWVLVSASDAGAPHRRERVFILAWPAADAANGGRDALHDGGQPVADGPPPGVRGQGMAGDDRGSRVPAANAGGHGREGGEPAGWAGETGRPGTETGRLGSAGSSPVAQDTDCTTGSEWREPAPGQAPGRRPRADTGRSGGAPAPADAERDGQPGRAPGGAREAHQPREGSRPAAEGCGTDAPANPSSEGRKGPGHAGPGRGAVAARPAPGDAEGVGRWLGGRREREGCESEQLRVGTAERDPGDSQPVTWGAYEPAIRRWEAILGRPAPRPTEPGRTGERLSPRFVEWLMGLPDGWVTDVPGLTRNAQLKALGNGVVPQQAAMTLRLLLGAVEAGAAA